MCPAFQRFAIVGLQRSTLVVSIAIPVARNRFSVREYDIAPPVDRALLQFSASAADAEGVGAAAFSGGPLFPLTSPPKSSERGSRGSSGGRRGRGGGGWRMAER